MIQNNLEIKKNNSDCAQYTGTVTVSSYLGDRLIQTQTHHNAGLRNLFEFIGSCLQGNFYEAKSKRPCKLVMLKQGAFENMSSSTPTTDSKDADDVHYWSSKYAVCSPLMYDTAAVNNGATGGSSSVTYHFRVPFLSLTSGSSIKKLMLLPATASDYRLDACAYFVLDNQIEIPAAGGNFTVIIDWTLNFTNSKTDLTNEGDN